MTLPRIVFLCLLSRPPYLTYNGQMVVAALVLTDDKNIDRKSLLLTGFRCVPLIKDGPLARVLIGYSKICHKSHTTQQRVDPSRGWHHLSFFCLILAFSVQLHKEIQQTVFRFSSHNVPISFDPTIQRIISVCLFDLPKPTKTEKKNRNTWTHAWVASIGVSGNRSNSCHSPF